jgi:hypothetical protein
MHKTTKKILLTSVFVELKSNSMLHSGSESLSLAHFVYNKAFLQNSLTFAMWENSMNWIMKCRVNIY